MTKDYWARHRNASDWKPGSSWRHEDYDDASLVDVAGEVIECTPPHRLVVTWADPRHLGDPAKTSSVTYAIDPVAESVRLTVTHEELEPDSAMLRGISAGWPAVLSSLKSLLETGEPMAMMSRRCKDRAA